MAVGQGESRDSGGQAQWLPGLGWAELGAGGGEAVYTSQDEPTAMTEVLRRWPRESGAPEASAGFCG